MSLIAKAGTMKTIQTCDESPDFLDTINQEQNYALADYNYVDCGNYFTSDTREGFLNSAELTPIKIAVQKQNRESFDSTEKKDDSVVQDFLETLEVEEESMIEKHSENLDPLAPSSDTVEMGEIKHVVGVSLVNGTCRYGIPEFRCTVTGCSSVFTKRSSLLKHCSIMHKPRMRCPHKDCDDYILPAFLTSHFKSNHCELQSPNCEKSLVVVSERNFRCNKCNSVFLSKGRLTMHHQRAHENSLKLFYRNKSNRDV